MQFRFCPICGSKLQPFSDGERLRSHCPACGWIHYRNPTTGVAVILCEEGQLLLGERRDGGWCIPCGHVEWDEDIEEAARREFAEETGLIVKLDSVFAVHSNFHSMHQHTVGIWYIGRRLGGALQAGGDVLRVSFFYLDQLPVLKFPTDRKVVSQLLEADYGLAK